MMMPVTSLLQHPTFLNNESDNFLFSFLFSDLFFEKMRVFEKIRAGILPPPATLHFFQSEKEKDDDDDACRLFLFLFLFTIDRKDIYCYDHHHHH